MEALFSLVVLDTLTHQGHCIPRYVKFDRWIRGDVHHRSLCSVWTCIWWCSRMWVPLSTSARPSDVQMAWIFCEIPLEELMSRAEALPPTKVNLQVPTYPLLFCLRTIIPRSSSKGVNHIVVAWRGSACTGVHGRVVGGTRRGRHPTSGLGGDVTTPAPWRGPFSRIWYASHK
jgi:hypothetical protein